MTEVYRVTIPGPPGPAKVNHRFTPVVRPARGKPRAVLVKSGPYRSWVKLASALMRTQAGPRFPSGPLACSVAAYWPRCNRTGPAASVALGDVDSVVKAVLDALTVAGVIGDDAQFVRCELRKAHDPANPRIEVEVWPSSDDNP